MSDRDRDAPRATVLDEILANRFHAIAEEMSSIILRAAHTTFVKETQDYSASLSTPEGEMFAYPHSTGVTSLLGMPLRAGIEAFDDWAPGDILITNDPFTTRGMTMHLPDITLLKPVFHEGKVVCFVWTFMHCSDVGGSVPGSTDMKSHEIFQEGLRLRPAKLYRRGELNVDLWNVVADNCRIPHLNWGDVGALVAGLNTGERRIQQLIAKYGIDDFTRSMYGTLDITETKTRAVLSRLKKGRYSFVDYLEDDYVSDVPVKLALTLEVTGDGRVVLDYTDSDPQVRAALNLPTGDQKHHPFLCLGVVMHVITASEGLHLNAGIHRCIELVLPRASIVNASFPAACGMRYLTVMRLHDVVLGAMTEATGGRVPSTGAGGIAITVVSVADHKSGSIRLAVANPVYGGGGAGPELDGIAGVDYPLAFFRNVPTEILEVELPVHVHGFGLVPDTEGAGRFRGGFGVYYSLEVRHPDATVVMRGKERYKFHPWGVLGGKAAATGRTYTEREGSIHDIGKTSVYRPALGEKLTTVGPGGGGYGSPAERDPAAVLRDVLDELVSPERARSVYRVAIVDGRIDEAATRALRSRRDAQGSTAFDFGAARVDWEERYGPAAAAISRWLKGMKPEVRGYCKQAVYEAIARTAPSGTVDLSLVRDAIARVERQLKLSTAGESA